MSDETKKPGLTVIKGGAAGVGEMLDNAEPLAARPADGFPPGTFEPTQPADDMPPIDDEPDIGIESGPDDDDDREYGTKPKDKLPDDFPVEPLGLNGDFYYYLDANGQYRVLKHAEHSRLQMASLLGARINVARWFYPVFNKDRELLKAKWDHTTLAQDLMQASALAGIWRALDRVRGPGAWVDDDGGLILHCGDRLMTKDGRQALGKIGRNVYPADEPQPRPAEKSTPDSQKEAADRLLKVLGTWNWKRKEVDPRLLFGWIAAAMVGGALPWRPTVWTTGGAGTGKTTLNDLLGFVFNNGLIKAADTSAAGVWTALGFRSLPVVLDEQEAEADDRKQQAIIKFARLASSGGLVLRGSADHKGAEFKARSCFSFSSILVPALTPQDLSRMAILELDELEQGLPPMSLRPGEWRAIGAELRARLLANWPLFKQTLHMYRVALATLGHNARGCDQFGTLLACADLLVCDEVRPADEIALICAPLTPATMNETVENLSESERCLNIIRTAVPDTYKSGHRPSVAELISEYWNLDSARTMDAEQKITEINKALGTLGLRVFSPDPNKVKHGCSQAVLMVANDHVGLRKIYEGSPWANGVWRQSLLRARGQAFGSPFEAFSTKKPQRIAGAPGRGVMVPLPIFVGLAEELDAPAGTPQGASGGSASSTTSILPLEDPFELQDPDPHT